MSSLILIGSGCVNCLKYERFKIKRFFVRFSSWENSFKRSSTFLILGFALCWIFPLQRIQNISGAEDPNLFSAKFLCDSWSWKFWHICQESVSIRRIKTKFYRDLLFNNFEWTEQYINCILFLVTLCVLGRPVWYVWRGGGGIVVRARSDSANHLSSLSQNLQAILKKLKYFWKSKIEKQRMLEGVFSEAGVITPTISSPCAKIWKSSWNICRKK